MSSHPVAPRELLFSVARDLILKGWQPVWCLARQSGGFTPIEGTTGYEAPFPVVVPQPAGAHRLGFRPPPSVVILDIDHYDTKRGADTMDKAEAWLGDLPLTYKVTSRGLDSPSGRLLFRKPEDLDFSDRALAQFADEQGKTHVEILRTGHRFSWAPGDINHKNGLIVACFDPYGEPCTLPVVSDIPALPERWVAYLRNPPALQSVTGYVRPADGPQWWLAQPDESLGSDDELKSFAFNMMLSRVGLDEIFTQWFRVSRNDDPSWPWSREDFDRHTRSQAQDKAARQIAREDAEEAVFEGIAGGPDAIREIVARTQADYENRQLLAAALEPQVPFDPALYQQLTENAGIVTPNQDDKDVPLGHMIRRLREYDHLLWNELARTQARKDAAVIQAGTFEGYQNIADLPEPPEPETLIVVGKDCKYTRCIGRATITVISGHRSSGKTWAVATWAAQELRAGNKVIWLDFERQPQLLASKLRQLGIAKHVVNELLQYSNRPPQPDRLVRDIERACRFGAYRVIVVIDAFRSLQNHIAPGTSANDGDAVEQVYADYLTPAIEAGANLALLDHMPKNGASTFGSERKESAADYVVRVDKIQAFSKKAAGYSCLTMVKDRYGNTEEGAVLGYLWVPGDGSVTGDSIRDYPAVPELRNWAPESGATLEDVPGASEKARREEAIIEIVSDRRLQLGPRPLGRLVQEVYPELFDTVDKVTALARRMCRDGKLVKEDGRDGKYDLPAPVMEVHSPVSPADLRHEAE